MATTLQASAFSSKSASDAYKPKHRHHPTAITAKADTVVRNGVTMTTYVTTSTDTAAEAAVDTAAYSGSGRQLPGYTSTNRMSDNDLLEALDKRDTVAVVFIIIAMLLVVLIVVLAPFVLVFLLSRYLYKRYSRRMELAEKAIAAGQPVPGITAPKLSETMTMVKGADELSNVADFRWNRGIKEVAVGVGLCFLFYFIPGMNVFIGIGVLVACLGAAKIFSARRLEQRLREMQSANHFASTATESQREKDSSSSVPPVPPTGSPESSYMPPQPSCEPSEDAPKKD